MSDNLSVENKESAKIEGDMITVRGYISPGPDPLVWPWVRANVFVKNQLATMMTFSCETFLRLEALGIQTNNKTHLDRESFISAEEMGVPGESRRYTPQFQVSKHLHPYLYAQLRDLKEKGASTAGLNRYIMHTFECWLLAYWARTTGNNASLAETQALSIPDEQEVQSQPQQPGPATPPHEAGSDEPIQKKPSQKPTAPPTPESEEGEEEGGFNIGGSVIKKSKAKAKKANGSALTRFTET